MGATLSYSISLLSVFINIWWKNEQKEEMNMRPWEDSEEVKDTPSQLYRTNSM